MKSVQRIKNFSAFQAHKGHCQKQFVENKCAVCHDLFKSKSNLKAHMEKEACCKSKGVEEFLSVFSLQNLLSEAVEGVKMSRIFESILIFLIF